MEKAERPLSSWIKDIPGYDSFKKIESIDKGLSNDKKYYIETADDKQLLLRVSDITEYENKKTIFNMMKQVFALNIPMPFPVDFGVCNKGKSVYQLMTWCHGQCLEEVLPTLTKSNQYKLGLKAGEILSKIHSIAAPNNLEDWSIRYLRINDDRIKWFIKCGVQIKGSNEILRYYEDNKYLLNGRPQYLHHGDYHNGNFLITDKFHLSVIDWELLDYGNFADPWEEFNRIGASKVIPHFTTGLIRGYFHKEPPMDFWKLLAFYLSAGALMLVSWAFYLQKEELENSIENANNLLYWFNNMNNPVPRWYLKDFCVNK